MIQMPHNTDAEMAVLGAMLYDNSSIPEAMEHLHADDFYTTGHKRIFATIQRLADTGAVVDILTVSDALKSDGLLDKIGGTAYVSELTDSFISTASVKDHAAIIRRDAEARRIIEAADKMKASVLSGHIEEAITEAHKNLLSVSTSKKSIRSIKDLALSRMDVYEARALQGGVKRIGISTGLESIDDITGGLQNSDLIIIAGRPSMGKSALVISFTKSAVLNGVPTLFVSLEMPAEAIADRILADLSGKDLRQLTRGFVREIDWPKIAHSVSQIGNAPLFIDDDPNNSPAAIRAKARRLKADHGLGLLVVDYIQLVRVPGKHDTREQAVAEISRTLKGIARELNIPVIGLSQLNRQVDGRTDKRPMLSDLRESGAIEQDADVIAFIYRDEVYNKRPDNPNRGIAEIEIAKHRNGPVGLVKVCFTPVTQTFSN